MSKLSLLFLCLFFGAIQITSAQTTQAPSFVTCAGQATIGSSIVRANVTINGSSIAVKAKSHSTKSNAVKDISVPARIFQVTALSPGYVRESFDYQTPDHIVELILTIVHTSGAADSYEGIAIWKVGNRDISVGQMTCAIHQIF